MVNSSPTNQRLEEAFLTDLDKYDICLRAVNDWLSNKEKEGLVKKVRLHPWPIKWELTENAKNMAKLLIKWKKDLEEIKQKDNYSNLHDILISLQVR